VTERGLPLADGAPACPFVAFDDDRDERASVPDHRHRCYADARPTPRALAHQEAYCLSSSFPVCPTFQDWARREAARSRGGAPTAPSASAGMNRAATGAAGAVAGAAAVGAAASGADDAGDGPDDTADPRGIWAGPAGVGADIEDERESIGRRDRDDDDRDDGGSADAGSGDGLDDREDDLVRRNPPRDWAAPPPWLASNEPRRDDDSEPPAFLGSRVTQPGQGLAGSAADRLAGGPPPARRDDSDSGVWSSDSRSAAAVGAGLAEGAGAVSPGRRPPPVDRDRDGEDVDDDGRRVNRRPRAYAQHLGGPDGPDWERPRRYEAYPVIKTRVGMPAIPRTLGLFVVVIVIALALLFLPSILNLGGGAGSPGSSAAASQAPRASTSLAPTEVPVATPAVYTIKKGDTLLKVAKAHGITIEELLAANPAIKNPNKISEGQQITIPAPSDAPPDTVEGSTTP
jgi:hypothetical protein